MPSDPAQRYDHPPRMFRSEADLDAKVLLVLVDAADRPWPPSHREIAAMVRRPLNRVHASIARLVAAGLVTSGGMNSQRTLRATVGRIPLNVAP